MSRPTTGGILLKPNTLKGAQRERESVGQLCDVRICAAYCACVCVPVQVEGSDLCIVPLKVREVVEIYIRLCISGLSVTHTTYTLKHTVVILTHKLPVV